MDVGKIGKQPQIPPEQVKADPTKKKATGESEFSQLLNKAEAKKMDEKVHHIKHPPEKTTETAGKKGDELPPIPYNLQHQAKFTEKVDHKDPGAKAPKDKPGDGPDTKV